MTTYNATNGLEIRRVDTGARVIVGRLVRYGELSLLTGDAAGERFMPGAFAASLRGRAAKVPLLVNHGQGHVLGTSRQFDDSEAELVGTFTVNKGDEGDRLLDDLRNGYYSGMSVGMIVNKASRGVDGVREVRTSHLLEASVVGIPAYDDAKVLALRHARWQSAVLPPRPSVDLTPIPSLVSDSPKTVSRKW